MDHSSFQFPGDSQVAVPSAVVQYFFPVSSSIQGAMRGSVHVACLIHICGKRESIKCQFSSIRIKHQNGKKRLKRSNPECIHNVNINTEREHHKTNAYYLATDGVVKILRLARGCETNNDRNNREYKCQQRASVHFAKRSSCVDCLTGQAGFTTSFMTWL